MLDLLRRFLPKTLLARSLIIIVMPLVVIQVVMAFIFYDDHWSETNTRIAEGIAGDVALITAHFRDFPNELNRSWMVTVAKERMKLDIVFREGQKLSEEPAFVSKWSAPYFITNALDDILPRPYRIDGNRYPREVYIDVEVPEGILRVAVPESRFTTTNTYLFVLWMAGTSVILFILAVMFMNTQVRPIRRLARSADDFGKGRDVPGFQPAGASEVRQAAAAFLTMKERIQRQISQRTEMLAGVSHDLRTPLTRMKLQLAMLGDTPEIEDLKSDITEMEVMLESYLAFARGESTEEPRETDLRVLLDEVVAGARRDGGDIALDTSGPLLLPARPVALRRGITNLVANARRHADHVRVVASHRDGLIEIVVDDDGPGIPAGELEGVFKPFYRLEPSRNRETGGAGLGLTIARDVIRGHGGEIVLDKSPMGGLRAQVTLPL